MMTVGSICLMAALCGQVLEGGRYFPVLRLALGMEIASMVVSGVMELWKILNG